MQHPLLAAATTTGTLAWAKHGWSTLWPWLLALALFWLLALGGTAFWLWRRRQLRLRKRRREHRLKHPLVLAHGICGFDEIKLAGRRHSYFRVAPKLRKLGAQVYCPDVPPIGSIAQRAEVFAKKVSQLSDKKVNVIAHSMGGLDARYALSELGLKDRVASLTTIGTPHHGTPLADIGTGVLGEKLKLRKMLGSFGVDLDAFYDLTTERMTAFNRKVVDVKGVSYHSVVASVNKGALLLNPLLLPAYLYVFDSAGLNDGLVPASSQRWGEVVKEIEADHWAQIGWSVRFDAEDLYAELVRELRGRGF